MKSGYFCCSCFFFNYNANQVKKFGLSFTSIWNTVVWLMLMNFFVKILTSTAQNYLKQQQQREIDTVTHELSPLVNSNHESSQ